MAELMTVGDVARLYALPLWKVREAVDALEIETPRAGLYRLISQESLKLVLAELQRREWLASGPASEVSLPL